MKTQYKATIIALNIALLTACGGSSSSSDTGGGTETAVEKTPETTPSTTPAPKENIQLSCVRAPEDQTNPDGDKSGVPNHTHLETVFTASPAFTGTGKMSAFCDSKLHDGPHTVSIVGGIFKTNKNNFDYTMPNNCQTFKVSLTAKGKTASCQWRRL